MSEKKPTSVVIDPLAMNIANKISKTSTVGGNYATGGGILIEGSFTGNMHVHDGPLVLMDGAHLSGCIDVEGDAYIFGIVGTDPSIESKITVKGELHLTSKCEVHGKLMFGKLAMYQGAKLHGVMESLVKTSPPETATQEH